MDDDQRRPKGRKIHRTLPGRRFNLMDSATIGGGVAEDEEDLGIDLNQEVIEESRRLAQSNSAVSTRPSGPVEEESPAQRLRSISRRYPTYAKEYRLSLMVRLLFRNVPLDRIAEDLGISFSQAEKDRAEIGRRFRDKADSLDINEMVGTSQELYGEVTGLALRMASKNDTPPAMKLAAMRTAIAAHNDSHKAFVAMGVYDTLRYRKANQKGEGDLQRMLSLTRSLLTEVKAEKEDFSSTNSTEIEEL